MATRPVALITGGSAGIGEAFARRLAGRGHDLLLVARRGDRLEALTRDLAQRHGASAEPIVADLATEAGVDAIEARLREGGIDLLVNNAGFGTVGEFARLAIEREVEEVDLNARALLRLCHAALGPMIERRRGAILNIASSAAFQPIPYNATYAATKAFVLHFSEALHEEAKPHGVTVTAVCPGPVKTEFQQVAGIDETRIPAFAWVGVDTVVDTALTGVRAGRAIVVPGAVNQMTSMSTRMAPRFLTRRIAGSIFKDRA